MKCTLSKFANDMKSEEWLMQQLTGAAIQRDLNTGWRNCNVLAKEKMQDMQFYLKSYCFLECLWFFSECCLFYSL